MSKILSKKVIVSVAVLLAVVIVFFIISYIGKNDRNNNETPNTTYANSGTSVSDIDTDSDGLKDWEEALWGTDPQKADSDDDGTIDGEEVLAGRNPIVAAPDDEFTDEFKKIYSQITEEESAPVTHTEKLSQDLIKGYITLKQNNALGSASQENFLSTISSGAIPNETAKEYTKHDIIITYEGDQETLQNYANSMAAIFEQSADLENDAIIVMNALRTQNEDELQKLDVLRTMYEEKVSDLLSIKTPQAVSSIHLAIINDFSKLITANTQMKASFFDPLLGLIGVRTYADTEQLLITHAVELGTYFWENGIQYK
ncbi:hypothetical protein ACFL0K_02100 [Patescibacteria group bacterium]